MRYAGQSMEVRVPAPGGAVDARFPRRPDRRLPRRAQAHLRLQLRRPAEDRAGQFLRLGLRPDRAAGHSEACRARRRDARAQGRCGRSISTAPSATRRSTTARRCCPAFRLDGPAVVEEFGSTTVVFPGQVLEVDPHGMLIVRASRRPRGGAAMTPSATAHAASLADRAAARRARGRSDRAADRRGHAQFDRGRDRIRHRAHRALADDPRGARLSRRPVRPLLPQAHRPLLFGDAERGGARFSARDHAAGRRVPDERHLSDRRQHRPSARPLQHRAGVS